MRLSLKTLQKNGLLPVSLLSAAVGLSGCVALKVQAPEELSAAYRRAVIDAAQADADELSTQLWAVDERNEQLMTDARGRIKVVTWKSQSSYEKFIQPNNQTSAVPDYAFWVTLAPQTQQFCQQYLTQYPNTSAEALDLRLKQWLGLNPAWQYDVMVELWLQPEDLFRPCVDPEPSDSQCELNFSTTAVRVAGIADYPTFFNALYTRSFRAGPGVPWTGLGYTYDWFAQTQANATTFMEVGASEFITKPSSRYEVAAVVNTFEYCQARTD